MGQVLIHLADENNFVVLKAEVGKLDINKFNYFD